MATNAIADITGYGGKITTKVVPPTEPAPTFDPQPHPDIVFFATDEYLALLQRARDEGPIIPTQAEEPWVSIMVSNLCLSASGSGAYALTNYGAQVLENSEWLVAFVAWRDAL